MSNEVYSDYISRRPHEKSERYIKKWHEKLLNLAFASREHPPLAVLEVGPGHSYFAEHCRSRGIDYEFCDTSPAVYQKMLNQGFNGHLGMLHEVSKSLGSYDIIWMSHVLEHSPSWLDARQLMAEAGELLVDGGTVVIISPDILSWRHEFWNVDWSHGYPTSLRNVTQLCNDVGFDNVSAQYHRNASTSFLPRAIFAIITTIPHRLIDRILTPDRYRRGDGFVYSWKGVFGWRQIMVQAQRVKPTETD